MTKGAFQSQNSHSYASPLAYFIILSTLPQAQCIAGAQRLRVFAKLTACVMIWKCWRYFTFKTSTKLQLQAIGKSSKNIWKFSMVFAIKRLHLHHLLSWVWRSPEETSAICGKSGTHKTLSTKMHWAQGRRDPPLHYAIRAMGGVTLRQKKEKN